MATKDPTQPGGVLPREKDGTVSLHEANLQARANETAARKHRDDMAEVAKMAIEDAYRSPLDKPRGGRHQKPVRG